MKSLQSRIVFLVVLLFGIQCEYARAQIFLGNTSANWSTGTNWTGGSPPSGSTAISFAGAPAFTTSVNDICGTLNVLGIGFLNGGTASFTNTTSNTTAFTLNGNKIILGGSITTLAVPHSLFVGGGGALNDLDINDVINLKLDLSGNQTMTINQAGTANSTLTRHHLSINGDIGQTGPTPARLSKSGDAILRLHGNNSFTGGLQMNSGTTQFSKQQSLSTGPLILVNGALEYTGTGNATVSNPIGFVGTTGARATLIASGVGNANSTVRFDGTLTHAGLTSKTFALSGNNSGTNVLSTVLTDHPSANTTVGQLSLSKSGIGRWTVDGNNTFTGQTIISQGVLAVPRIELDTNAPQPLGRNSTIEVRDTGRLSYVGSSPLVVDSNRTLVLNSTNSNPTAISVVGGALANDASPGNTVSWNSTIVYAPSTLERDIDRQMFLLGSNTDVGNKLHSQLTDGANFVTSNATYKRTFSLNKSSFSNWELTGNNLYSGTTTAAAGTLRVSVLENKGAPSNIGTGASVGSGNSSINLGASNTIGTLEYIGSGSTTDRLVRIGLGATTNDGSGARITNTGTGPLVFTGEGGFFNAPHNGNSVLPRPLILGGTYAGQSVIEGIIRDNILSTTGISPVRLQKDGTTTWALHGNNTYTGNTQVNQGTLLIHGNQSSATGNVTVAAAGRLGGTGMLGGVTSIVGTLAPGNSPGVLSFANNLSLEANSTLEIEIQANSDIGRGIAYDGVNVLGSLMIDPSAKLNLIFDSPGSTVDFSDPFWQGAHSFLIFDNATPYTGTLFSSISLSADSFGRSAPFGIVRTERLNGEILLTLAIPEPTTSFLVLWGLGLFTRTNARRRI